MHRGHVARKWAFCTFVRVLYPVRSPQSTVHSPQSIFYTDRFTHAVAPDSCSARVQALILQSEWAGEAAANASSVSDFIQLDETKVVFRYPSCTEIYSRSSSAIYYFGFVETNVSVRLLLSCITKHEEALNVVRRRTENQCTVYAHTGTSTERKCSGVGRELVAT